MRRLIYLAALIIGCAPTPPQDDCVTATDCINGQICRVGVCVDDADAAVSPNCSDEVCDGLDNDCDGSTDEDFHLGVGCEVGVGQCLGRGSNICGPGQVGTCSAVAGVPEVEQCNGRDDDCDGIADNVSEACVVMGCEALGTVVCVDTVSTCVATDVLEEVCGDGVDNNCDGVIDEGCECEPGTSQPCGSSEEGLCQNGTNACIDGLWAAECEGQITPSAERCTGQDENCDGRIDEGFDVGEACTQGVGACAAIGVRSCTPDGRTFCNANVQAPADEVCDALDNDCDGQTDEGVTNACGTCGDVPAEVCNGRDDNCDGRTDEGCPCQADGQQLCGTDVGLCTPGAQACVSGQWGPCSGQGPEPETCDGHDNDCDGVVDNGVLNACGLCGLPPQETCNDEDDDCDGSVDEGVTNTCGGCGAVPAEICDGVDNDCDGQTDEGLLNACGACGAIELDDPCDGVDNDCDGHIDEDVVQEDCSLGLGECRATGRIVCVADGLTCNAVPDEVGVEACNGLDDDCDGVPDNADGLCVDDGDANRRFSSQCAGAECTADCVAGWFQPNAQTRSCLRGCDPPLQAMPAALPANVQGAHVASLDLRGTLVVVAVGDNIRIALGADEIVLDGVPAGTWDAPAIVLAGDHLVVVTRLTNGGRRQNHALILSPEDENGWGASALTPMGQSDQGPGVLTVAETGAVLHFVGNSGRGATIHRMSVISLNGEAEFTDMAGIGGDGATYVQLGPLAVMESGGETKSYAYLVGLPAASGAPAALGVVSRQQTVRSNLPVPNGGISVVEGGAGAFSFAMVNGGRLHWGQVGPTNEQLFEFTRIQVGAANARVQAHQLHPLGGDFVLLSSHADPAGSRCQARFLNDLLETDAGALNLSILDGPCEVAQFSGVVPPIGGPQHQGERFVFGTAQALQTVEYLICE